jgi:hypothetical protein
MSCLSEVFYRKVPMPDCPSCHGVSTYEAFTLEAIRDWGTEDLVAKADIAQQAANLEPASAASIHCRLTGCGKTRSACRKSNGSRV